MRTLATIAVSFSFSIFLFNYAVPHSLFYYISVTTGIFLILCFPFCKKYLKRRLLIIIPLVLGALWNYVYYSNTVDLAEIKSGATEYLTVEVRNFPTYYEDYFRFEGKILTPGFHKLKIYIYCSDIETNLHPGDVIEADITLKSANIKYGEKYDNYIAKGIFFTGNVSGKDFSIAHLHTKPATIPVYFSNYLEKIAESIFPRDIFPFVQSLMLGEKSNLYKDVPLYNALSRAGLMHIVAVSGMHVSFLYGFISGFFGKGRKTAIISIFLIVFFVLATGAGPSVIRASIMLTFMLLAPILQRENDSITSLSTALMLILLVNPLSCTSVSLQLSFGATAGIVFFGKKINDALYFSQTKSSNKLANYLLSIISCSLSVLIVTVPLTAVYYGSVQILSPLTNMLCLWAVSLCFCGGYISCLLGAISMPLGKLLAIPVSLLYRYIIYISKLISSIKYTCLYTTNKLVIIFIITVYFMAAVSFAFKLSGKLRLCTLIMSSVFLIGVSVLFTEKSFNDYSGVFAALDVGQGECLIFHSANHTVVVDCGSSGSLDNSGAVAGKYLLGNGINKIDALILTHLHSDHSNGVPMLIEMVDIGSVIIPAECSDESIVYDELVSVIKSKKTELYRLEDDVKISFSDLCFDLFAIEEGNSENEKAIVVKADVSGYIILVMGDVPAKIERELIHTREIGDIDLLVAGHHGSKSSTSTELIESVMPEVAVVSCGYNSYGHPTYEVLDKLNYFGCQIFRTDLNGNIEMYLVK